MKKNTHSIDIGIVPRRWEYSKEPRLEGLFKMLKAGKINYTNLSEEEYHKLEILTKIENKKKEKKEI